MSNASKRYFGTDGIRGRVGEYPITPDFMLKLGWAAGKVFSEGGNIPSVLIGKDTRISGYMFESALEAGLAAAGVNTQLLGPMPTPAVAYLTRTFRAQAGIVISASHNPHEDNGIKFFSSEGRKLDDAIEERVEMYLEKPMTTIESKGLGKASRIHDATGRYIEFCKGTIPAKMDFTGTRIVVDCANGATYHIAPHVFTEVGAEVICIGAEPNGLNINDGVGATKPKRLQESVLRERADYGIALDGDGDRLLMVDSRGEVLDGDELLYIIARSRFLAGNLKGPVVGTVMTNLGMERALLELGTSLMRAPVGDRYVSEMMFEHNSLLGGETSGHIICGDRTTTGDGIVSALQVMAAMWSTRKSLNELKAGMVKYPQVMINVRVRDRCDVEENALIRKAKADAEQRLAQEGRLLLRASGTEPVFRIMVEGVNRELINSIALELSEVVTDAVGFRKN
jgi:phosphoglucosamine mutase